MAINWDELEKNIKRRSEEKRISNLYQNTVDTYKGMMKNAQNGGYVDKEAVSRLKSNTNALNEMLKDNETFKNDYGSDTYNAYLNDAKTMQSGTVDLSDYADSYAYKNGNMSYEEKKDYIKSKKRESFKDYASALVNQASQFAQNSDTAEEALSEARDKKDIYNLYKTEYNNLKQAKWQETQDANAAAIQDKTIGAIVKQAYDAQIKADNAAETLEIQNRQALNAQANNQSAFLDKNYTYSLQNDYSQYSKQAENYKKQLNEAGYDADSLLDTYRRTVAAEQSAEEIKSATEENPVLMEAVRVISSPQGALSNAKKTVENIATDYESNYNNDDAILAMRYNIKKTEEDIAARNNAIQLQGKGIDGVLKVNDNNELEILGNNFGNVNSALYDNIDQSVENIYNSLMLGGGISGGITAKGLTEKATQAIITAIFSSAAMGDEVAQGQSAINSGKSTAKEVYKDAIKGALINFGTEMVGGPLEWAGVQGNGVLGKMFVGGVNEASEEIIGNFVDNVSEALFEKDRGDIGEIYAKYIQSGASDNEALKLTLKELLANDIFAALQAGFAGAAMNIASSSSDNGAVGKSIANNTAELSTLKSVAQNIISDESVKSDNVSKALEKVNKKASAANTGSLYASVVGSLNNMFDNASTSAELESVYHSVMNNVKQDSSVSKAITSSYIEAIEKLTLRKTSDKSENELNSYVTAVSKSDGKAVELTSVAQSGNGSLLFETADGKTVSNESISFDEATAQLMTAASEMNAEGANILIENSKSFSDLSDDYLKSAKAVYELAKTGMEYGKLEEQIPQAVDVLNESNPNLALEFYKAGVREYSSSKGITDFGSIGNKVFIENEPDKNSAIGYATYKKYSTQIYNLGAVGTPWSVVSKQLSPMVKALGFDTAKAFYEAGVADSKVSNDIKENNKSSQKKTKKTVQRTGKGTVTNETSDVTLDEVLKAVADKLHININYVADGSENGSFNPENAVLTIVQGAKRGDATTLAHEIGEYGRAYNNPAYKQYVDTVINMLFEMGAISTKNDILAYYKAYQSDEANTTIQEAKEELVNDVTARLFFTEGGIEQVVEHISQNEKISVKEKKNFFETLKEIINKIVDVIKKHVTNNHLSASEKAVADMSLDDVKRLRTQFLDVIDGAIANLENGVEIGNETKKSIVVLEDGRVYVKAARKVITATDLSGQRSQITSFFNELLKDNNVLPIPTIDGNTLYITKNETAFKARDNYVSVNGQRIKLRDNDFLAKMNAEAHVDELAEISLPQNSNDRKDNKNHKFAKGGFTYRTAYFEDFDGKYYQVTLSIGKGNIATVYNVVLKEKGNAPVRNIISAIGSKTVGAFPNNSVPQNTEKSNIKKSLDVDSDGNTLSEQQQEYFKDSKVRDENGNLLVVYHGTSEEFTVFDREKSRHNMDIQGSFFSPWELDASGYGNNVRAFYLNITNPASESLSYKALRRFQGQNNTGVKAREYLESLGYDGVNNGNEEYIAFNSNQIKAVDNLNPTDSEDIRYSKDVDFEEYDESFDRNVIDSFGIAKINDYRHVQIQVFNTLANEGFFDENASRIVTNANSGMKVEINESGIEAAFDPKNYGNHGKRLKILKLASIRHVPDIIENGTLTFDNEKNYHNDNSNVKYAYIEGQTILNGKPVAIRITVRKSLQKNKFWVHNIYTNEKNTTDLSAGESFSKTDYLTDSDDGMLTQDLSNVKFSKDVENYDMESLIKQNEKLQKTVEYYKMMMGRNSGHKVNRRKIRQYAVELKKEYNSAMSTDDITASLTELFDFISSGDATWDTVEQMGNAIGLELVESAKAEISPENQEVLDYLKQRTISIDDFQRNEIKYMYGDMRKWLNVIRRGIKYSVNSGVPLDSQWVELSSDYPYLFDPETSPNDQPQRLYEAIEMLFDTNENDYGYTDDEMAEMIMLDIYNKYFEFPQIVTPLDRADKKLIQERINNRERLKAVKQDYKRRYENKVREISKYYQEMNARLRDKKNKEAIEKLAKQRAKYEDREKRINDTRERARLRKSIRKQLNKILALGSNPTKEKHIPNAIINSVKELAEAITLDGTQYDERLRVKLNNFRSGFEEHKNETQYSVISELYNDYINEKVIDLNTRYGSIPLKQLPVEALREINDLMKMTAQSINNINRLFKKERNATISDYADRAAEELNTLRKTKLRDSRMKSLFFNTMKPIYFFEYLGSDTLTELYRDLRKGEDVWVVDVNEARDFAISTRKKYNYSQWDFKAKQDFESKDGTITLTLEEMLGVYANSLGEHTRKNLLGGGFKYQTEKDIGLKKYLPQRNDNSTHRLSVEQVSEIVSALTEEQREYVREMIKYLSSEMGAKGNEVARELYGVELFKEKTYYPSVVDRESTHNDSKEVKAEKKVRNSGFTHHIVPQAKQPIILKNFDDVWATHIDDMSKYHAFLLPLENFDRVYNLYRVSADSKYSSTKEAIKNAHGQKAILYIDDLIRKINGGVVQEAGTDIVGWAVSKFKKNAVFASMSVVVQQPSAIGRALSEIDAKYFASTTGSGFSRKDYAEMKKYAPIAAIKEMGYFDTNMAQSTVDYINSNEYEGIKQKIRAFVVDGSYRDEALSFFAEKADEITWTHIWNACKREARANSTAASYEQICKAAAEKFTDVIVKTQVYDSVFSRSGLMRSNDNLVKNATAFMAEPTTAVNMLGNAIIQTKRGKMSKTNAARVLGSLVAASMLNALLQTIVTAARADGDDDDWKEVYLAQLIPNFIDNLNPINQISFIRDIWSIFHGYDVTRSDMNLFVDLFTSIQNMYKDNVSLSKKISDLVGSMAAFLGVPAKNIMRDINSAKNVVEDFIDDKQFSGYHAYELFKEEMNSAIGFDVFVANNTNTEKYDRLYDYTVSEDSKNYDNVYKELADSGADEKTINNGIVNAICRNEKSVVEGAMAYIDNDTEAFFDTVDTIVSLGFSEEQAVKAIKKYADYLGKAKEHLDLGETEEYENKLEFLLQSGYDKESLENYISEMVVEQKEESSTVQQTYALDDILSAVHNDDSENAKRMIDSYIAVGKENGKTEEEVKNTIKKKLKSEYLAEYVSDKAGIANKLISTGLFEPGDFDDWEKDYISNQKTAITKKYKQQYINGDLEERKKIIAYMESTGYYGSRSDIIKYIKQYWL